MDYVQETSCYPPDACKDTHIGENIFSTIEKFFGKHVNGRTIVDADARRLTVMNIDLSMLSSDLNDFMHKYFDLQSQISRDKGFKSVHSCSVIMVLNELERSELWHKGLPAIDWIVDECNKWDSMGDVGREELSVQELISMCTGSVSMLVKTSLKKNKLLVLPKQVFTEKSLISAVLPNMDIQRHDLTEILPGGSSFADTIATQLESSNVVVTTPFFGIDIAGCISATCRCIHICGCISRESRLKKNIISNCQLWCDKDIPSAEKQTLLDLLVRPKENSSDSHFVVVQKRSNVECRSLYSRIRGNSWISHYKLMMELSGVASTQNRKIAKSEQLPNIFAKLDDVTIVVNDPINNNFHGKLRIDTSCWDNVDGTYNQYAHLRPCVGTMYAALIHCATHSQNMRGVSLSKWKYAFSTELLVQTLSGVKCISNGGKFKVSNKTSHPRFASIIAPNAVCNDIDKELVVWA